MLQDLPSVNEEEDLCETKPNISLFSKNDVVFLGKLETVFIRDVAPDIVWWEFRTPKPLAIRS